MSDARQIQLPSQPIKVVIWGAGGHAKVIADITRNDPKIKLEGFLDDVNPQRWGTSFYGSTIVGDLSSLETLKEHKIILGIGHNEGRVKALRALQERGIRPLSLIAATAYVSPSALIGDGCVIMPHAVVNADSRLGSAVIINTAASVDHDCTLDEAVHIAPGVRIAGGCTVGRESMVGIGSSIRDRISIGEKCNIGAGSVVVANIPSNSVAFGNPARIKN